MKNLQFFFILFPLIILACSGKISKPAFTHTHLSNSLFNSPQNINLIEISNSTEDRFELVFGEDQPKLIPTSTFADSFGAFAAVNAGFFDMRAGGSVTYFEINDSTLSPTQAPSDRTSKSETLLNGAVVITKTQHLILEPGKSDSLYAASSKEEFVLVTGPLLLQRGQKISLADKNFVNDRHPRTVLCSKKETILLATIDGRSETAAGMNLHELQDFLLTQHCLDAINLDGGGSTTMWIKGRGVVNQPSDKTGERPVANVLMVLKKPEQ